MAGSRVQPASGRVDIVWLSLRPGDSGRLYLWLAWLAALGLYLPTLAYGVVGYDDAWLVRDN